MSNRSVYLTMTVTALFWSGAFIAGKMAAVTFEPLTLTCLRFLLALPFIFLLLRILEPHHVIPLKEQILPLIILGIIGTLGYHYFFFKALKYTTAINSSLIGASNPMVTTLLAVAFFKEKITPLRLFGVILSLFGVFSVITGLNPEVITKIGYNKGDFYMTLGVLCFSTYALLSRAYMARYRISPLTATAYTFLVCTILSLALAAALEDPWQAVLHAPVNVWFEVLYMALLASVIGYYFQLNAIRIIGAPQTAMFINLVPVFTILLASLILKEQIHLLKLLSAGFIISGVYLASRPEKKKPNP